MSTLAPKSTPVVRVVSYNVLSSHLASPTHFTSCDPIHLNAKNRLGKILSKLEKEMMDNPAPTNATIFCLQEVSHDWASTLHTFFANRKYYLVTGLYGKKFNGYMGIALAYPTFMETVSVDLCRLSDKRVDGWPRPPRVEEDVTSWMTRVPQYVYQTTSSAIQRVRKMIPFLPTPERPSDHWEHSEERQNMIITVGLKLNESSKDTFWVGNYHMPCAYYAPMVMNIHIEMAAKHVQKLAGSDPYVLAGDFNVPPSSAHYKLITTGDLDRNDPSYPTPLHGREWTSTIAPMRSAYAVYNRGNEPDFTNYAKTKDAIEPFIETLDYIFLSPHWVVKNVKELHHRKDILDGPFPNAGEPSDHLLIAADLSLS